MWMHLYSWQHRVSVPSQCGRNFYFPFLTFVHIQIEKDVGGAGKAALLKVSVLPVLDKFVFCLLLE